MGKIKIRGQELKRIGYKSDRVISFAINLVKKDLKRSSREEILAILEKINLQPDKYLNDRVWGKLAQLLTEKSVKSRMAADLKKSGHDFKIFGEDLIDPEAIRQMEMAMRLPISVKGALMPDAHVGYGLPIGGVLAAYNAVIPYGVGMDIGCRMCLSVFPFSPRKIIDDREQIKRILMSETRFGLAGFRDEQDHEILGRKEFNEIKFLKTLHKKFAAQLGTSGHGNHFVDVGSVIIPQYSELIQLQAGEYFGVLSHSGSRNFGAELCRHYTGIASGKLGLRGAEGQLAWLGLGSEEGEEYWAAMNLAGDYSHANHRIIHRRLARAFGETPLVIIENHHNFAWKETLATGGDLVIHRKGATPAGTGDIGVIPGTMASPAFIVAGKGNEESLNSASHGAGRKMSRNAAVKDLSEKQMKEYLDSRRIELLGAGTDESPFAYKDIHEVMDHQKDLVEILGTFHPAIVRMA